jgi:hypothetical protein
MTKKFSTLDLLDLPRREREVFLCLSREGPADPEALSEALDCDLAQIQDVLAALLQKERVRRLVDGRYKVSMGRITRHTTLPPQLWPALLTTDRIYTEQEIATLRTAIPMLQFARAKLSEFNDHGPGHGLRVKSFATQLGYVLGLTQIERHLLRAAALFHDIGNVVDRERHNVISQEAVIKLAAAGKLPFTAQEAQLIGLLCRWHRREYDPHRADTLREEPVRTGLLASILRVADAMDIDHRRSDYGDKFRSVLEFFYLDQLVHWTSLEQVLGVRIRCTPAVHLQVFTRGQVAGNPQISMLRGDVASTPLDWSVTEKDTELPLTSHPPVSPDDEGKRALLVFPFEPHSLVMAALSRKHLLAMGCDVELYCYPDTPGGPAWLWGEALPGIDASRFARLVVIGDRPDPSVTAGLLDVVRHWQELGVAVSILNRHEANWSRLPRLLELGVDVVLGGDWAYFWGDAADEVDLEWGRIAALCTRDSTQSSVGISDREQAIVQGLLRVVYERMSEATADDTEGWSALAEPILGRVAADDRAYFGREAGEFVEMCTGAADQGRVQGRVVVFDRALETPPQTCYWIMEAAIERLGRLLERGIRFAVPYSIATWPDGDAVELLALSHWREEEAVPVRLLYPGDLGPPAQGNESTIRARLSTEQAAAVLPAFLVACNRLEER